MGRKSCAISLPELNVTQFNCGCQESKGRFNRIARNAILPFYYNCLGSSESCRKIFHIKNPQYFSGASVNNPGSHVTQAMRYARLSREQGRTIDGQRKNIKILPIKVIDNSYLNIIDQWYPDSTNNY